MLLVLNEEKEVRGKLLKLIAERTIFRSLEVSDSLSVICYLLIQQFADAFSLLQNECCTITCAQMGYRKVSQCQSIAHSPAQF